MFIKKKKKLVFTSTKYYEMCTVVFRVSTFGLNFIFCCLLPILH